MTKETFSHDYPPAEWRVDDVADALRTEPAEFPLPRYGDTEVWSELASDGLTAPVVDEILDRAQEHRGEPVPRLPASLYLDYSRTGNRTRYQELESARTDRLATFALAACFQREGECLDDVLDYGWAICEQATWVLPAHLDMNDEQAMDGLPGVVPDEDRCVALHPAGIAQQLAELDYVLGNRLHPAFRDRIRSEVDRRVLTPYEERDDFWWHEPPTNNWNAVCNAGAVIAALYLLDDYDRQAGIVAKAARSLEGYLADFDEDGCTAEGIGYWNYGFGNYAQLAATLESRTNGECSLLSPPIVEEIARYPLRVEMSPGRFIPFSDATENSRVDPFTACWLGRRFDLQGLATRGRREFEANPAIGSLGDTLRAALWARRVPSDRERPAPPKRQYFGGYDWWVARADPDDPEAPVAVAKGGHNVESHNHNDLGSFVFHHGGESHLTDLGAPVYDADFFGGRRYEYLVARSLGHNVPHVNGVEQAAGSEYAATVLDRTGDDETESFAIDVAGAYPDDAALSSLRRTFTLDRSAGGRLTVEDAARFAGDDNEFVEVLVSYFPMEATDDGLVVRGANGRTTVSVDPDPADVSIERLEDAVRGNDVWRARVTAPGDGEEIETSLVVEPESPE